MIEYRRASLTHEGRTLEGSVAPYVRVEAEAPKATKAKRASRKKRGKSSKAAKTSKTVFAGAADATVAEALKLWRLAEARRRRTPAFNIFPNRTLEALATLKPKSAAELLEVPGIGPRLAEKYGRDLLKIVDASVSDR